MHVPDCSLVLIAEHMLCCKALYKTLSAFVNKRLL